MQNNLFIFSKHCPYLPIEKLIEYYSVFEGLDDLSLDPDLDLFENIKSVYFDKFDILKEKFTYTSNSRLQKDMGYVLTKLSRGDRKRFSIYKHISRNKGNQIYKILFDKNIIKEEISREKPIKRQGKRKIKKELRRYRVENKIHFTTQSCRFWFNFISPNEFLIRSRKYDKVLGEIRLHLKEHVSLSFELLSSLLIRSHLPKNSILSIGSYWSKKGEIDLLVKTKNKQNIVGESKWKNTKICKNVLNSIKRKAQIADLNPSHYALFSKSGFSKEILNSKDETLMLFDLKDFERLAKGKNDA